MPNPTRRMIALAVLAVAIVAAAVALELPSAAAQSEEQRYGKITARRVADDRIEFGWQPTDASGEAIGPRVFPRARFLPQDAPRDRWLSSSPVEVEGEAIGRINARMLAVGRIEFAFTPTDGERILPPARYFPHNAERGRWLSSTTIAIGPQPTSTQPAPESSAAYTAVSAGVHHTCAIRAGNGAILCWGWNNDGQADAPVGSYTAVGAGVYHTCAIRAGSGVIECWGSNDYGQTNAPAGSFSAVSAGDRHTCAIRAGNGVIECWGMRSRLINLPAGSFSAVSAGSGHTCAIRAGSGVIECWGNRNGQAITPGDSRFTAVATGSEHRCAIRESGAIKCWGSNDHRETNAPAGSFSAVSAGSKHTCAIRAGSGAIECWGSAIDGQTNAPAGRFTAVAAGTRHTCAIRAGSGAIECWGRTGTPPTGRFSAVSGSCAIRDDGAIVCWEVENSIGLFLGRNLIIHSR